MVYSRFLVFLLAFICSSLVHWSNHAVLSESAPEMLRMGVTVATADDPSYLTPAENWMNGDGWHDNAAGAAAYLHRSPGYGLWYLVFRVFFTPQNALWVLMLFQILLFSFSATFVPAIARRLGSTHQWGYVLGFLVAVLPLFSGFLSYTLTEAITPSLMLIFLGLALAENRPRLDGWAAVLMAALLLVRPVLGIFFIPYLVFLIRRKRVGQLLLLGMVGFMPFPGWQIWGKAKTGNWPGVHRVYFADANDLWRPLHGEIWDFHKSWGQTGAGFHHQLGYLWQNALKGTPRKQAVSQVLLGIPPKVGENFNHERLKTVYTEYYDLLRVQAPYFKEGKPITEGVSPKEIELSQNFRALRKEYVSRNWIYSNAVIPVRVYGDLAFHSNLNLYLFQKWGRGKWFVETLRYLCFGVHSLVFLVFPFSVFLVKRDPWWIGVYLAIMGYLVFLCFVQRGVEERYTIPVLAPMFIYVAVGLFRQCQKWMAHLRG